VAVEPPFERSGLWCTGMAVWFKAVSVCVKCLCYVTMKTAGIPQLPSGGET